MVVSTLSKSFGCNSGVCEKKYSVICEVCFGGIFFVGVSSALGATARHPPNCF